MSTSQSTVAALFVDISGSTRLYDSLGDAAAHARVEACLALLLRACDAQGGRVVKSTGDGLLCAFGTADEAMNAARAMHESVAAKREVDADALGIHVGCHYGPVIESAGDLYGDTVNLAAGIAGLAKIGQVITTEDTYAQLSPALQQRTRRLQCVALKGKREEVTIYEFVWRDPRNATIILGTKARIDIPERLLLRHEGREIALDSTGRAELTLGRESACDLVIHDPRASREHARIERRRGHFHLIDHSSNGTFVRIADADEFTLRRAEVTLRNSGAIGFGRSPDDPGAIRVEFRIV